MDWPYGNNLGPHDPTEEQIQAAYEKGDFDGRVMDDLDVQQAIHFDAMKASNNGQDKDAYCQVWRMYHARRTAYWMNEIRLKPDSWQDNEAYPVTVKLVASAGNHRTRAAKMLNLAPIDVVTEAEAEVVVEEE
jgi:hypothetical protein